MYHKIYASIINHDKFGPPIKLVVKTCQDLELKLRVPWFYIKHSKSASWVMDSVTWSYGS